MIGWVGRERSADDGLSKETYKKDLWGGYDE